MSECPEEILALLVDAVESSRTLFALCRTSRFLRKCAFRLSRLKKVIGKHFPSEVLEVLARKKNLLPIFESFQAKALLWWNIENISPIQRDEYPTVDDCDKIHEFIVKDFEEGVPEELAESLDRILSVSKGSIVFASIRAVSMPYFFIRLPIPIKRTMPDILGNSRALFSLLSTSLPETFSIPDTYEDCCSWNTRIRLRNDSVIVLPKITSPSKYLRTHELLTFD